MTFFDMEFTYVDVLIVGGLLSILIWVLLYIAVRNSERHDMRVWSKEWIDKVANQPIREEAKLSEWIYRDEDER